MINAKFKAHPIIIFSLMRPYLFILILPLIRAIIQDFAVGKTNGLLELELIFFGFIFAISILGWLSTSVLINGRRIVIKKGFFIKSCAVIEMSRISSVSLKRSAIDFIFRSASCVINTEAGKPKKSDFDIKLGVGAAKRLYNIVSGVEDMQTVRFSALRIALLAATTSSAVAGIIAVVPFVNQTSNLIGVAISEMLLNEISNISLKLNSLFPPIVNAVTIILFIAYVISFVISLFSNMNFKLRIGDKSVEVHLGIIVRKKTIFRKAKVNDICFDQTPLMRFLKRYSMKASVSGYGIGKGERAVIVPLAKRSELEDYLKTYFPLFNPYGKLITPDKDKRNMRRVLLVPALLALSIIGAGVVLVLFFPYFERLTLFFVTVALGVNLYYTDICLHNYKFGKLMTGKHVLVSGSKGFTIRQLYCNKNKVGVIKIIQTPADRRLETCKLKITVRSESADSVKIKNLDIKKVVVQINKMFKLNTNE